MRFLKAWLPVAIWAAIILSAANDTFSDAHTAGWLERLFGRVPPEVNVLMRKTAHVTEYGILALLAWRARRSIVASLLVVLVVSSTDEFLQSRSLARTGTPKDVALDLLGGLVALAVWYGLRAWMLSRKRDSASG